MKQKASILIVEDEQKIRTALRDFLEFHGFSVADVVDGMEAERIVARKRFDLILLDLMLPKISGEQLCTNWRRDGLQTPIIMLTAKGQENERVEGLNIGADDYITKPFSLEELLARINAILRRTDPARAVGQSFNFADWEVDIPALKAKRERLALLDPSLGHALTLPQAVDLVGRYRDAGVQLFITGLWKNDEESLELLANEVMPQFG